MSIKPRMIEYTHCDRCDRRIAKERPRVVVQNHGVDTLAGVDVSIAMNVHCYLDMCKPCEDSLRKWWARGKKETA
jgi:hypothetical protein